MSANYVLLEKIVVGAATASSVTFNSIPQTGYTDLKIVMSGRSNYGNNFGNPRVTFNGSTTSFSRRSIYAENGSVGSEVGSDGRIIGVVPDNATANTFGSLEIYIPNYTSSNYKSYSVDSVTENNSTTQAMWILSGLWSNTAAITSISIAPIDGSFVQYSTFYLYGVAKLGTTPAIQPYATGGDTIMTDGTYWYHAFKSSGTFTPAKALSCDYLVVAGGGGAGVLSNAGGGGAGGLRSTVTATGGGGSLESAVSMASGTAYTVTIGAGGASQNNGSNSSISGTGLTTITSLGGGYGGNSGGSATSGNTGGSGGGAPYNTSSGYGSGTTGQGYRGGGGSTGAPSYGSGGGGGAGAIGGDGNSSGAGAGGNGVQITAFATPTGTGANSGYYAGGGGGSADSGSFGAAGLGGGGRGGQPQATGATSGTANTGGGGGGYATSGGSGIVIIRYAV